MFKYSLAILALIGNMSCDQVEAHKHHHGHHKMSKQRFAEGYGERENMGEDIHMKGNTLEKFSYVETSDGSLWQMKEPMFVSLGATEDPPAKEGDKTQSRPAGLPVRGDKDAIVTANMLEAFGDQQTDAANTRLPYHSTFLQTSDGERTDAGPLRGDHKVLTDSQNLVDWEDNQTLRAQTRIPYQSTLLQVNDPPAQAPRAGIVRGDHQVLTDSQNLVDWADRQTALANTRIPYASTLIQLNSEVNPTEVRGDHQILTESQNLVDWEDRQTGAAQTRPPYQSTVQIRDDDDDEEEDDKTPQKVENIAIPLNFSFVHVSTEEGDVMVDKRRF